MMNEADFNSITIQELEALGPDGRDGLAFGVIGFDRDTNVDAYNSTESRLAGLDPKPGARPAALCDGGAVHEQLHGRPALRGGAGA